MVWQRDHLVPGELLDSSGHVAVDLNCFNCGYSLRTLKIGSLCPECAIAVLHTLRARSIQYSPPRWLRKLTLGCVLLILAPGTALLMVPVLDYWGDDWPGALLRLFGPTLVLLTMGIYLLTRPDPQLVQLARRRGATRRLLFVATAGWVVVTVVLLALWEVNWPRAAASRLPGCLAVCGWGFAVLLLARHLWNLVGRGGTRGIVRVFQAVFWLVAATDALLVVVVARFLLYGVGLGDRLTEAAVVSAFLVLGVMGLLIGLAACVFTVARERALAAQSSIVNRAWTN